MTWIDRDLSDRLVGLSEAGEGQKVEFKEQIPAQARNLAKEIAAFATSGGGLILMGIRDDGTIVGVPNGSDPNVRDSWSLRITGICRDIEPPVRPRFRWAAAGDQVVLGIEVPAGTEPIYYADHRPFLRHETTCRPAKPSEVYDAIKAHTRRHDDETTATNHVFTQLASLLVSLLRWAHTNPDIRQLKPWVDQWEWEASHAAGSLRDLAAEESVDGTDLERDLRELAQALDAVANFTHAIGSSGPTFNEVTEHVGALAKAVMDKHLSIVPYSKEAETSVRHAIGKFAKKVKDLWERAESSPFSNLVPQAQEESGIMGRQLVEFSFYGVALLEGPIRDRVRKVGYRLFDLETRTMYYDGGNSQRSAILEGHSCSEELSEIVSVIERHADLVVASGL